MARLIRGLGSLAILLLGTAGVPVALAILGGNPLPPELTWSAIRRALSTPVDGMILVRLITIIGWLAWLAFTLSVISELVTLISQQRIRIRLPGLDAPQRFAAGLLVSVITMISVPHAVQADPDVGRQIAAVAAAPDPPAAVIIAPAKTRQPPALAAPRTKRVDHAKHHVVQAGDDLWSLAERYYGDGRDWRKIAAANPSVLTGGPAAGRLATPDPRSEYRRPGGRSRRYRTSRGHPLLDCRARARLVDSLERHLPPQQSAAERPRRAGGGNTSCTARADEFRGQTEVETR
jgi:hypothetical protein